MVEALLPSGNSEPLWWRLCYQNRAQKYFESSTILSQLITILMETLLSKDSWRILCWKLYNPKAAYNYAGGIWSIKLAAALTIMRCGFLLRVLLLKEIPDIVAHMRKNSRILESVAVAETCWESHPSFISPDKHKLHRLLWREKLLTFLLNSHTSPGHSRLQLRSASPVCQCQEAISLKCANGLLQDLITPINRF